MNMPISSRLLLSIILANFMHSLITPTIKAQLENCTERAEFCWNCSYLGEFTNTSNYKKNVDNLLSSFSSSATRNTYGFYNSSLGENSDKVNAIALCRVDVVLDECQSCLKEISTMLLEKCPNGQKEAILWGERCMVRYSNNTIFSIRKDSPIKLLPSPHDSVDAEQYKMVLDPLLDELSTKAAKGNSTSKFAFNSTRVSASDEPIFALLQCTPDLREKDCSSCLQDSISQIPNCCGGRTGARVLKPSCTLRFEKERFYNFPDPTYDVVPQHVPQGGKGSNTKRTVVIIVIAGVISVILTIIIFIFCKMRKHQKKLEAHEEMTSMESLQFDFSTVEAATDNFSEANKLGQGGFGAVYKGRLANGQTIAVKRLSMTSRQGDLEFKNEVMLVAKLQHRNLVRFFGFCLEGSERLLVYEFVPNASLNQFIFDPIKRGYLDWDTRYKIIRGIARGLVYLHEDSRLKIIHRDLKASNILLDEEMNPKIADFGMARLFVVDQTQENTSRIVGTYGYMAPEYAMLGQFSVKSDVYSFGVLLLEIVSGQKNYCFNQVENGQDLLNHAWKNWTEGTALNVVDPTLELGDGEGSRSEIMKCIHIALLCVQENPAERPTMNSVIVTLTSDSDITLPGPSQPRLFEYSAGGNIGSDMFSLASENNSKESKSNTSKSNSVQNASINEVSITGPCPR